MIIFFSIGGIKMKIKKLFASALAVTMLFSSGAAIVEKFDISGFDTAVTAQAEGVGSYFIKEGDLLEVNEDICNDRFILNDDYTSVHDGNGGIKQWYVPLDGRVMSCTVHGPFKVYDSVNDEYYWGFTAIDGTDPSSPDINNFLDGKGILFAIPEGEERIPEGMMVNYFSRNSGDMWAEESIYTKLYFGGYAVRFAERYYADEQHFEYYDSGETYETDSNTYTMPECDFTPVVNHSFGGWKCGDKVYQPGDKVTLTEKFTCFEPLWVEAKPVERINITITAPKAGEMLDEKAVSDFSGIAPYAERKVKVEVHEEDGTYYDDESQYFPNAVTWYEDGVKLSYNETDGTFIPKKAEKDKKYKVEFFMEGNDEYMITDGTKVYVNGREAKGWYVDEYWYEYHSDPQDNVYEYEFEFDLSKPEFAPGDVNGDSKIDIEDAVCIIQHINGMTPLTAEQEMRADVSKDGKIDIDDAVILISYINGNSTF